MEHTTEIDDEKKVIITRMKGLLTKDEVNAITGETRQQAKELGYKILLDFRETQNRASAADAYLWMKERFEGMQKAHIFIPAAHLVNEKDRQFFQFVETAWRNLGANVKLFLEEEDAWQWLESI